LPNSAQAAWAGHSITISRAQQPLDSVPFAPQFSLLLTLYGAYPLINRRDDHFFIFTSVSLALSVVSTDLAIILNTFTCLQM
jgi:hypothetical protein